MLWSSIARHLPPVAGALSVMLIPIVGLRWAIPLAGELPYSEDILAAGIVTAALALTLILAEPGFFAVRRLRIPRVCMPSA